MGSRAVGTLLVWLGLAAPALAQAAPEDEIIVTAPLEGSRLESLQGAHALGRDAIVENLAGGLGETLAATPGVSSSFFGAGASRPIVRGLGEDRVRVLENGIGAIDASAASPDHAVTADGLDAHRIEVLRGSAALAYGGNAVGGVINVLDESIPTRPAPPGAAFDVVAAASSVDEGRQGALGAVFGLGPIAIHATLAARETEDFEIPGFARTAPLRAEEPLAPGEIEAQRRAPNSWTSLRSYGLGGALTGGWGFGGLALKRYETEYGLPPEPGAAAGGRIDLEQTRVETRGDVRIAWGPFARLDWGAQHSDYRHTEFEPDGAAGTVFETEGYEARLEAHNAAFADKLAGAVGMQLSDVDFAALGEESFIQPSRTQDFGLFAVQRWDDGRYGFEGGARYETRDLDNAVFGARSFDAVSASLGGFVRPADNWFLGVTLARTERAPTATELFAEGPHHATESFEIGDPDLGLETALSVEASARYGTESLSFEANLYRVQFDGYIALVPNGLEWGEESGVFDPGAPPPGVPAPGEEVLPVFAFVQRDADFTGGEIAIDARLARLGRWTLRGEAAIDWVRAGFDAGGALPRIPPRAVRLGLEAEAADLTLRLEAVDIAAQTRVAAFETATEGSTVVNARAIWRPFGDRRDLSLLVDARNITDEDSRVHASFLKDVLPRPGRGLRLALIAAF